jgi:Iap family predicted aminopeptidase
VMPRLVELMKHLSATMEVCTCCTYSSLISYEKWMDQTTNTSPLD